MKVDVVPVFNRVKQEDVSRCTAIVVDTLRATSTITTALALGCSQVTPVETLGQALHYGQDDHTLLIGERFGKKVDGFHLSNSPRELNRHHLEGKNIVITSTNGTKVLGKIKKAPHILIGSLLNAQNCIEHALHLKSNILFVCAGRHGKFAIEDGLTAGYMIHLLRQKKADIHCSDLALTLEHRVQGEITHKAQKTIVTDGMSNLILQGETAKHLQKCGHEKDIHHCLQQNILPITGAYKQGKIVPLSNHILENIV